MWQIFIEYTKGLFHSRDPPASASGVLGLEICIFTPGENGFLKDTSGFSTKGDCLAPRWVEEKASLWILIGLSLILLVQSPLHCDRSLQEMGCDVESISLLDLCILRCFRSCKEKDQGQSIGNTFSLVKAEVDMKDPNLASIWVAQRLINH